MAFAGGVILNVMPCVLPVLSVKAMSIVKQAGMDNRKILKQSLTYTAGILVSFAILAAAAVTLRAAGRVIGWGFQFQNTAYIISLLSIVFLFALSLFDVFVIDTPDLGFFSRLNSNGIFSSFFSGVFAVILATPCTAPFLGTALGFAFSQTPFLIFILFIAIGLGLSLPFILTGFFPKIIRGIPKPGPWMSIFKEIMGFGLLLTALWLISVIGAQKGTEGVVRSLGFLLFLGLSSWVFGKFGNSTEKSSRRIAALAAAVIISAAGGFVSLKGLSSQQRPQTGSSFAYASLPKVSSLSLKKHCQMLFFREGRCL